MTTLRSEELTQRFNAEQWNDRPPAYASGGPLTIPPEAPTTLTEALLRRSEQHDQGVVYVQKDGQEEFQSYSQLLSEARVTLTGLRKLGLQPHARVILQIDNLRNHFTAFWACVLGGFTPVTVAVAPSYAEKNGVVNKLFNTWKLLQGPLIITSAHLESAIQGMASFLEMPGLRTTAIEPLRQNEPAQELYSSRPEDLVFFQLTSGSTGIPKCIQETHRGIIHHIHGAQQFNGYSERDVTLNWLPVDHVVPILTSHLKDVYIGARQIHVKTDIVLAEPLRWLDLIEKHRVTHTWCPNFGFKLVSDRLAQVPQRRWALNSLKFMMNAGEQVTLPVVKDFLDRTAPFGVRQSVMQPAFGMAEVCTCMTYQNAFAVHSGVHRFKKSTLSGLMEFADAGDPAAVTFVDLGPPVPGVEIRITDRENKVVPEGVVGRFQIRGAVVTPGYLFNDSANAEAFVGEGWFNSGDLGFIWKGRLTLTGREKEMIIVRGANFYCYEIEDVVNNIEGVEPTFVGSCAVSDTNTGTEGLAIFFVPKPGFGFTAQGIPRPRLSALVTEIKTKVASNLGISPSFIIPLEKETFPKTTSGKIQRNQMKKSFEAGEYAHLLDRIHGTRAAAEELKDSVEKRLSTIWQEMLGVKGLGRSDNFFALGGDSLLATRVISRVSDEFHVQLPISVLFNSGGTLAGMAEHIRKAAGKACLPPLSRRADGSRAPASLGQQRLWLADQLNPGSPAFNVGVIIQLDGPLNEAALRSSLSAIAARHEGLRARFEVIEGAIWQVFREDLPFELSPIEGDEESLGNESERLTAAPFDLATGPLVKARLVRLSPTRHALLMSFHQTVIDGWSLNVFYRELSEHYAHFASGKPLTVSVLPVGYGDYAVWQRNVVQGEFLQEQLAYWRKELEGSLPEIDLPIDLARPQIQSFAASVEAQRLSPELSGTLRDFAKQNGATAYMAIIAAYQAFLSRLAGQQDILVGTAIAGRSSSAIENLIGFFVNTVTMRADLGRNPSFTVLLQQTRDKMLGAYTHQHAPFEKLVEELQPVRTSSRSPIFQVWFGAWDPLPEFEAAGLKIKPTKLFMGGAQYELSLFAIDAPEGIELIWEYRSDLFVQGTIQRFTRMFEKFITRVLRQPDLPLQTVFAALSEDEYQERAVENARMRQSLKAVRRKPAQLSELNS